MLEEAFFYNGMVARAGQIHTWAELQAEQQELREAASKMQFPDLLEEVNKRLTDAALRARVVVSAAGAELP